MGQTHDQIYRDKAAKFHIRLNACKHIDNSNVTLYSKFVVKFLFPNLLPYYYYYVIVFTLSVYFYFVTAVHEYTSLVFRHLGLCNMTLQLSSNFF